MTHLQLARLCKEAYLPDGVPNAEEIGGMGPMANIVQVDGQAVVVFRGTADTAGWVIDLIANKSPYPGADIHAMLHRGFLEAWQSVRVRLMKHLLNEPVIITGHSLGGALATIAALELNAQEVVTFGCPRVGDSDFCRAFGNKVKQSTRYVHQLDPIPMLPTLLLGFRHVCAATWHNGQEWKTPTILDWIKGAWQQYVVRRDSIWKDHGIDNYIRILEGQP